MKPEGQEKCGEMANLYESNKVIQNAQQQVIKIIYKNLTICNQISSNHFKILLIFINDVDILIYRC